MESTLQFIHHLLDRAAALTPHKTALITDSGTLTYAALADRSRHLAGWFVRAGVGRGDRIAIMAPNGMAAVTALLAASRVGAIFFLVHAGLKPYHLRHMLEDAHPRLIVATPSKELIDEVQPTTPVLWLEDRWEAASTGPAYSAPSSGISSDPVCLIYTSGSTDRPKAVISSHRNILFATQAIQHCLQIQPSDVIGNFLPMSFDVGLYQLFLSLQTGATLALGNDTQVGPGLLAKLCEWNVTVLPGVPSLIATLIRLSQRPTAQRPPLRFITNTGAHLPRSSIEMLHSLFPTCQVFVMFGLTECKRVSILQPADYLYKPASVGRPLPDTECLIVDDRGQVLPPNEVGELVVRGPHVMLGYWRATELTAKRFRRWGPGLETALFTADRCSIDTEGYLYFHGRTDDIYKQGGYRVSALEIEAAACDIPGVYQAALIPPKETLPALLYVMSDLPHEFVVEELRRRLEDYKLPGKIVILDRLPLTSNGKVDRRQLHSLVGASLL